MINGMVLPMQVPVNATSKVDTAVNLGQSANSNKFGAVLASMTANEPIVGEVPLGVSEVTDAIMELLEMTTIEEIVGFLEENIKGDLELPEVIDGHFIIHDEKLMSLLASVFPNLSQLEVMALDIRDLLSQIEQFGENVFASLSQLNLTQTDVETALTELKELFTQLNIHVNEEKYKNLESLSKDDLITLFAVMQMISIEGPKTDLMLKQEQQLHSLQEMLKSLSGFLNENTQMTAQTKSTLPFMETKLPVHLAESISNAGQQFKDSLTETANQSAHHNMTAAKVEGAQLVSESQNNSRAEQLMKELQNIFKRANLGQTGGTNRISIKLYPEHLGQLRIELLQTNGLLTARILASNVLGKEMLESQLHQLRQAFLQQNIQVERIDISQMLTETPYREREQAFNEQFKQQQEQMKDQSSTEQEEESMSFSEYMIELEG